MAPLSSVHNTELMWEQNISFSHELLLSDNV